MSKSLAAELEVLASSLTTGDEHNSQLSIPGLAERIAKTFDVKPDEVAILAVSEKWRHLYFLVPQALRHVGQIPLSSTNALAARNVRDNRAEMINNFTNVRHASVCDDIEQVCDPVARCCVSGQIRILAKQEDLTNTSQNLA